MVEALQGLYESNHRNNVRTNDTVLTIAVHIRLADGRKIALDYFSHVIRQLHLVEPDAHVVVHTDDAGKVRGKLPGHVVIRDPSTISMVQVLNELIEADVLVASLSSLSNTAGLYNLGRPVLAPFDNTREGLSNLPGWHSLQVGGNADEQFYKSVVAEAAAFKQSRHRKQQN